MGHPSLARCLAVLPVALLALGCAGLRWELQKSFRSEGHVNEAFPEAVWEEYACGGESLPLLRVERNELIPPRVEPGGEFNHRIVYALCPTRPTAVVAGTLTTRILFRGESVHEERDPGWELRPGRWRVDTFVELPEDAEAGIYAYQIEFRSPGVAFDEISSFLVR